MRQRPDGGSGKHIPYRTSPHSLLSRRGRRFGWDRRNPKPGHSRDRAFGWSNGVAPRRAETLFNLSKANVQLGPMASPLCEWR